MIHNTALRDFLSWFEGFRENIEAAPSDKQWARVVERIEKLRSEAAAGPQHGPVALTAVPKPASVPFDSRGSGNEVDISSIPGIAKGGAVSAGPG